MNEQLRRLNIPLIQNIGMLTWVHRDVAFHAHFTSVFLSSFYEKKKKGEVRWNSGESELSEGTS